MKSLAFAAALGLLALTPLRGDSSLDGYFDNPDGDTVADPSQKLTQDELSQQGVRFFESAQADGIYVVGWTRDTTRLVSTPYNALNFSFGSDARLDKNIRAFASFFITYPRVAGAEDNLYDPYSGLLPTATELSFSNVAVQEMFLDYALGDFMLFRVGRERLTWGQGRIFNPTNFAGAVGSGMALKASTSLLGLDVTGVAIKNDGYFRLSSNSLAQLVGLNTLGFAGKIEGSLPFLSGGISGFHHGNVGDKLEGYLKTSVLGTDLFAEGLVERKDVKGKPAGEVVPSMLFGAFREFGGPSPVLQVNVEYMISGRGGASATMVIPDTFSDLSDSSVGVVASTGLLSFLKTRPSVSWVHSNRDSSGQLLVGVTNTAFPHVELSAGVVWIYGDLGTRYIQHNPDPEGRRLMLTLKATFQFDIDN